MGLHYVCCNIFNTSIKKVHLGPGGYIAYKSNNEKSSFLDPFSYVTTKTTKWIKTGTVDRSHFSNHLMRQFFYLSNQADERGECLPVMTQNVSPVFSFFYFAAVICKIGNLPCSGFFIFLFLGQGFFNFCHENPVGPLRKSF